MATRRCNDCRHNRAQLYHLNKRSLYAAIGQATSRLQRPLPLNQAIHRLMVLDAIVEDPEMIWLGTNEDKANHLTALTSITPAELPHVTSGIGASSATSRTACRSASTWPAAASSCTSSSTRR